MEELVKKLKERKEYISFMESCTGGYLSSSITNISGASDVLKVSIVTYSNEYKLKFGIKKETIDKYTVYSKEVAEEMAKQISIFADSEWGIGVTGKLEIQNQDDNRVYFSIYNKKSNLFISEKLNVVKENREHMKEYILIEIVKKIKSLLY